MTILSLEASPQEILKELVDCQTIIRFQQEHAKELKRLLTKKLERGECGDKVSLDKYSATFVRKSGKWKYSEILNNFADGQVKELERRCALERESGTATQSDPICFWTVRTND